MSRSETSAPVGLAVGLAVLQETTHLAPMERAREMTRRAVPAMFADNEADPRFYSWLGMTLSLAKDATLSEDRLRRLAERTAETYDYYESSISDLLSAMATEVGLRPKRDATPRDLDPYRFIARMGLLLIEGANVRTRFGPSGLPDVELPDGERPDAEKWSPLAFAYWTLIEAVMEVDPDVHPGG